MIPAAVAAFWAFGSWQVLALVRLIPPDILPDMRPRVEVWQRLAIRGSERRDRLRGDVVVAVVVLDVVPGEGSYDVVTGEPSARPGTP